VRVKEYRFPVAVDWVGGRRVAARVGRKQPIELAPPPEFRGTDPTLWSPEDLFVAAAASCLAVTVTGLAERERLPLQRLSVRGAGTVGRRSDGRFGFTRVELELELETEPGREEDARRIACTAEETCLVSVSLDLAVETRIAVSASRAA